MQGPPCNLSHLATACSCRFFLATNVLISRTSFSIVVPRSETALQMSICGPIPLGIHLGLAMLTLASSSRPLRWANFSSSSCSLNLRWVACRSRSVSNSARYLLMHVVSSAIFSCASSRSRSALSFVSDSSCTRFSSHSARVM
jgi:hypothetical protein